jgi:hypothetical protein
MEDEADIGHGSSFSLGDGASPEVFTEVAQVFDISPPSESVDVIDKTHMKSPDRGREFMEGLSDPGETSFEMNFVPGSAAEALILAKRTRNARITYPNSATWTFKGIRTGYEPAVPNEDKMTASVTYKVAGSVLRAAGA